MSISDDSPRPRVAREIVCGAIAGIGLAALASPGDPALTSWPVHPGWAIALLLAARYGARALWIVPMLWLGIAGADVVAGHAGTAAIARLSRGGDLVALIGVSLCAAVGTAHERSKLVLQQRVAELDARAGAAEVAVENLARTAAALNEHRDRSATSLAFLADVSTRLHGPYPTEAADAALELALARTGARAGFVYLVDREGAVQLLVARGTPRRRDRTAVEALERRAVVFADEVSGVRPGDSDVAAPVQDDSGEVVGVLALRGVPYAQLATTLASEVAGVARWSAPALSRARAQAASSLPGRATQPIVDHDAKARSTVWRQRHGA
jgi:hypothetical protein